MRSSVTMPWRRLASIALLALALATGGVLRFSGLANDLERGYVYHPDTPKQIVAVQSFLAGEYEFHTGNLNYDAYPYFNSRLVQGLYLIVERGCRAATRLVGLPELSPLPDKSLLFWLTRLLNASLATATILLGYALGALVGGRKAGLLTAWLIALAPIEVVTCHYAMSESTAAFFAVTAVLLAAWSVARSRPALLIPASAALVAGFAAKYHAAAVAPSLAVAFGIHLWPHRRAPLKFVALALLCIVAAWLTLAITTPSFAHSPLAFVARVGDFMAYTANFNLPDAIASKPLPLRLLFGITHNLPHFAYNLTWLGFLLAGAACFVERRRRGLLLTLAAAPAAYILIGLASKPFAHAEYHTIVTPVLAALCAATVMRLRDMGAWPLALRRGLIALLVAVIALPLAQRSLEQVSYFRMHDTRRLAHDWVQRNLPATVQLAAGHYAYPVVPPQVPSTSRQGIAMLSASFRPHPAPASFALRNSFRLGDHAMELFRNPEIDLFLHDCDELTDGVDYRFSPPFPAQQWSRATPVLDEVQDILVDQRTVLIDPEHPARTRLVVGAKAASITLSVVAGPAPTRLKGSIGGRKVSERLAPHERLTIRIDKPRQLPWLRSAGVRFYAIDLRMPYGIASLAIGVDGAATVDNAQQPSPEFLAALPGYELPLSVDPRWGGAPLFLPAGQYGLSWLGSSQAGEGIEVVDSLSGDVLAALAGWNDVEDATPLTIPAACGMLVIRPAGEASVPDGARLRLTLRPSSSAPASP